MVLPVSLTAGALVALLFAERTDRPRLIWKGLASAGFVWAALAKGLPTTTLAWLIVAGLVASFIGDIALVYESGFLAGLVAFALAHVFYAGAFVVSGTQVSILIPALLFATIAFLAVRSWLLGKVSPRLHRPVIGYMVIISVMLVTAAASTRFVLYAGAALFYLSDLAVARQRFVMPGFENKLIGLPLYYSAQLLLASTVT